MKQDQLDWISSKDSINGKFIISQDKPNGYRPTGSYSLVRSSDNKILVGYQW